MVDWTIAPAGAAYYSESYFRNKDGDLWSESKQDWVKGSFSVNALITSESYEPNPNLRINDSIVGNNMSGAIKSDGGSSSYYDISLPDWLISLIVERRYIKTEELIEVLGGDFDEANILKCLVRINSLRNGKGKEGNTVDYDCNKISYSANRIKEVENR